MEFDEVYKRPFHNVGQIKAYSVNGTMSWDWLGWQEENGVDLTEAEQEDVINKLNTDQPLNLPGTFMSHQDEKELILMDNRPFLLVRGWGRLTGTGGGLGLSSEEATRIQDNFINWLVERLNSKS